MAPQLRRTPLGAHENLSEYSGRKDSQVIRTAIFVATALSASPPVSALAQQLKLSADVGKTEFFEGEPIYLLVRLENVGTDTAWVTFFGLGSLPVMLSLTRGNGHPVPVHMPFIDWLAPPNWRGDPIAPGGSVINTLVLQDLAGDEQASRSHLFLFRFTPDRYELHLEFSAHAGVPGTTPLLLKAAPVSFRVRERTAAEEAEVKELESMRDMAWDTIRVDRYTRLAGYKDALIHWIEQRLRDQPDDPFLPFLLDNGVYGLGPILMRQLEAGKLPRFDPDTSEVVSRLRLAVIERQKSSTGGTRLVQALSARHPEQLAALANSLGSSPSGDMARYQVKVSLLLQRSRSRPQR